MIVISDTAARINQYLNTKFDVCILIKPGAYTKQLVDSLKTDFECLGKNDVIVINGGANDIDKHCNNMKGVLAKMMQFIQKYRPPSLPLLSTRTTTTEYEEESHKSRSLACK
jgi:lysophospholipase L1-like esterase